MEENLTLPQLFEKYPHLARLQYEELKEEENNLKEEYELALKAMERLPEDMKQIMQYRIFEELSYEDISIIIDLPIGTVKSRINRARLRIIEIIKEIEMEKINN